MSQIKHRIITPRHFKMAFKFRPFLFPNLSYVKNEEEIKFQGFAKFGNDLEISVWSKLSAGINSIASILTSNKMDAQTQLAFHSFGRYWRKCIYEKLSDNYQVFDIDEEYSSCVLCILNSQLSIGIGSCVQTVTGSQKLMPLIFQCPLNQIYLSMLS